MKAGEHLFKLIGHIILTPPLSHHYLFTVTPLTIYTPNPPHSHQVRAGESLLKLIGHIKQYMILNDFPSANELLKLKRTALLSSQRECDDELALLRDEMSNQLRIMETEYYSSPYKS